MSPIKIKGVGETVSELLRRAGHVISLPCGGRGICGGCAVLASGKLDLPSEKEKSILDRKEFKPVKNFEPRLACMSRVLGDAEIIVLNSEKTTASPVFLPDFDGNEQFALGIAADIGVTAIILELHNLTDKVLLSTKTSRNPQMMFSEDVLNRITYSQQVNSDELHNELIKKLWEMIEASLLEAKVFAEDVRRVVFTGSTFMLCSTLGLNPAAHESLFGESYPASELFPPLSHAEIYLPRCVNANIGADLTCGLYAADCLNKPGSSLFIDAGTNIDLVLVREKKIICASAAANYVSESPNITMGIAAEAGAVQHVRHTGYGVMCDTISDAPPAGICGSGLISAASLLLDMGELDETGYLETDPFELGTSRVHIHGRNIRGLQSAKSAVAAGISVLLESEDISMDTPERLILAGMFGDSVDAGEAAAIGLIPTALKDKTTFIGNAALLGAVLCLYSQNTRQRICRMASEAVEFPLMENPKFTELQKERMAFKPF